MNYTTAVRSMVVGALGSAVTDLRLVRPRSESRDGIRVRTFSLRGAPFRLTRIRRCGPELPALPLDHMEGGTAGAAVSVASFPCPRFARPQTRRPARFRIAAEGEGAVEAAGMHGLLRCQTRQPPCRRGRAGPAKLPLRAAISRP
jgi:hypothetical protein